MGSRFSEMRIFSGSGNPALASAIADRLGTTLGDITLTKFPNDNIFVRLNESVREKDVFIVQSLSTPLSDRIMELNIMLDACRRAAAGRVTAVLPFFAYGRTDKRDQPRVPITARLLADMIQVAGAQQVITLDLHAGQIQGFFSIPVDELSAMALMVRHFKERRIENMMVVSPDMGFAKRARNFAEKLGVPLAIVEKRHLHQIQPADEHEPHVEALNVIGEVSGRHCVLVDDEVATGGSLIAAAELLMARGATAVSAAVVHPILAGQALDRLQKSPIDELVTTDTLPIKDPQRYPNLTVLSVSTLLAEVIQRIHSGISVDSMSLFHRTGRRQS
jgi:ribose-phosphate pyrophosphokinase